MGCCSRPSSWPAGITGRMKMGYTIRRWLSSDGFLIDDSRKAKTADEAIRTAETHGNARVRFDKQTGGD